MTVGCNKFSVVESAGNGCIVAPSNAQSCCMHLAGTFHRRQARPEEVLHHEGHEHNLLLECKYFTHELTRGIASASWKSRHSRVCPRQNTQLCGKTQLDQAIPASSVMHKHAFMHVEQILTVKTHTPAVKATYTQQR